MKPHIRKRNGLWQVCSSRSSQVPFYAYLFFAQACLTARNLYDADSR